VTVTTGSKAFTATKLSVPAGSIVTATATNLATGDTSEFSQTAPTIRVTSKPTVKRSNSRQKVTLSALVTGPTAVGTGTATFCVQGLSGSVTVNVSRTGVATAAFTIPANVVGSFRIIAVYNSVSVSFVDSTSTPLYDGVLTITGPTIRGRRIGGPHVP